MDHAEQVARRLKLRQLEVLLAVVQSGSMAKASEHLAITQPVISKSIADLESTLGLRLLDRSSRGVEPTVYGRALIARSVAVFNDLRTSVNELEFMSEGTGGHLRIGSSDAIAFGMLSAILERLGSRYPRLTFETISGLPYDDLLAHKIDLVIGRLPNVLPDEADVTALYEEEAYIVTGEHNALTRRRKVPLAELVDYPWCGNRFEDFPFSLWADAFRVRGLKMPRNVVVTRSLLTQMSLARTGRFLAILPRTMLHFAGHHMLRKVSIDLSARTYPVGILTLKGRTPNPIAQLFIDCAREVSKPFTKAGMRSV